MTFDDYDALFRTALGSDRAVPHAFQKRFATAPRLYEIVRAPTGSGKTETALLGWAFRRFNADAAIRAATPRRLVYCLPMRVLVEQTHARVVRYLRNLGLLAGAPGRVASADDTAARYSPPPSGRTGPNGVAVYTLMGGAADDNWVLAPEANAVLIGTQDMLLSRALNRGYAASRFRWPVDFGLLNNDCLWVYDELQLMGSGVSTSAQLAGLRAKLGTWADRCPSVWMSATMDRSWLRTVDLRDRIDALSPDDELVPSDAELQAGDLGQRMTARKVLSAARLKTPATDRKGYGRAVAAAVLDAHREGTLTLVVTNTVGRAREVYDALRARKPAADLMLVHSRFRPAERAALNARLTGEAVPAAGRIAVATQVVEAGVDISARVLFTELAPWPSLVQRFGRCHRRGGEEFPDGQGDIFWIDLPTEDAAKAAKDIAMPYEPDELNEARNYLAALDRKDVSPRELSNFRYNGEPVRLEFEHAHVIRRRDVLDLFDTAPDLSGNDIDIARFVRSDDPDTDVQVFWRPGPPSNEWDAAERRRQAARRVELCSVPIGSFKREFLEAGKTAYRWDFLEGVWEEIARKDVRSVVPGQTFWVTADQGGYDTETGWSPDRGPLANEHLVPVPVRPPRRRYERPEGFYGSDEWAQQREWRTVAQHTDEVAAAMAEVLAPEAGLSVPAEDAAALRVAARWHDWGKVHDVFQSGLCDDIPDPQARAASPTAPRDDLPRLRRPEDFRTCPDIAKAPQEFWRKYTRVVSPATNGRGERRATVKRFRHELASALGVIRLIAGGSVPSDWAKLTPDGARLALYLIAAHHGKVRLSIRTMPDDSPVPPDAGKTAFACGIWEDDPLPAADLGGGVRAEGVRFTLAPMRLGRGGWTADALDLLHRYGPFRLAYLEALLRAADCRASDPGEEDSDA